MLPSKTLVLAFAATASAVEVVFYRDSGTCSGGPRVSCTSTEATKNEMCCSWTSSVVKAKSVHWTGLSKNKNYICAPFSKKSCTALAREPVESKGKTSICLGVGSPYHSAKYRVPNASRRRGGDFDAIAEGNVESTGCARPDTLTLWDGTAINLSGLDDASYNNSFEIGMSGANVTSIPEEFLSLVIGE
ncbi:hypothetical protein MN608_10926 [Microdochium nivale]|nr:hypothetical protein MN608_10926 [Microdochium nivale]